MSRPVTVRAEHGKDSADVVLPDFCPACRVAIDPAPKFSAFFSAWDAQLRVVLQCPRHDCQELFIAYYDRRSFDESWHFKGTGPRFLSKPTFDPIIQKLSPEYVATFTQAEEAESLGLNLVCGMAYRRALEFLVKDYLGLRWPEKKGAVQKKTLGICIQEYIDDPDIKDAAERAAWLGNDETHYLRKWPNHDVEDLKELLKIVVGYILLERRKTAYKEGMPKKDAKPQQS